MTNIRQLIVAKTRSELIKFFPKSSQLVLSVKTNLKDIRNVSVRRKLNDVRYDESCHEISKNRIHLWIRVDTPLDTLACASVDS